MKSAIFYFIPAGRNNENEICKFLHILYFIPADVDIEKPWVKLGQVGHQVVMAAQNQLTFVKTFTFNEG